jgi:hypothetical protein
MAYKTVVQFLEATSKDQSLRDELASVIGVGDGDISSAEQLDQDEAQAMLGKRGALVAAFAANQGYEFTLAELNGVIGVIQQFQRGDLSEQDFYKAVGWSSPTEQASTQVQSLGDAISMVYRGVEYSVKSSKGTANQVLDFMKLTAEHPEIREQLQAILAVGDGDISDFSALDAGEAEALRSGRGALVAEFAARHGFKFTLADLLAVTDAFQRVQAGELTSGEFENFLDLDVSSKEFFPFIKNVVTMTYKGVKYSAPVTSRSNDNTLPVVRFMEASGSDPALRDQIMSVIGGDGDISSPGELDSGEARALNGERGKQIVEIGAEHGFIFSLSDLSAVLESFQLVNEGKLPLESCTRILGLGKSGGGSDTVKKTAGMIYRGVRY